RAAGASGHPALHAERRSLARSRIGARAMEKTPMRQRILSGAAALALAGFEACTTHAPRRLDLRRDSAEAIATTTARLADESARREMAPFAAEIYPDFTVAFIEFDDQGRLWSRAQLDLLDRTLDAEAAREGYEGVAVVFFAHGWEHD